EVGGREVVLRPVAIELLRLMRALRDERTGILPEEVVGAVGDQREVIAEVAVAGFDVHLVADRAVPLALVHPASGVLLVGLLGRLVGVGRERQAVRLNLLAPLVVTNQLVLLIELIGALADQVPQLGVEGLVEL